MSYHTYTTNHVDGLGWPCENTTSSTRKAEKSSPWNKTKTKHTPFFRGIFYKKKTVKRPQTLVNLGVFPPLEPGASANERRIYMI